MKSQYPRATWVIAVGVGRLALLLSAALWMPCHGQSRSLVKYSLIDLPSARLAQTTLLQPANLTWAGVPLREGLANIERAYSLSIWLDRRIDPGQTITVPNAPAAGRTLDQLLDQVAKLTQTEFGLIENVVYFGPPQRVARIQRSAVYLHDMLSQRASDGGAAPAQFRAMTWGELTTPSALLDQLCESWNIKSSIELPHDLLHSGQLIRPATLATQLTILTAGFDIAPVLSASGSIDGQALPASSSWSTIYSGVNWSAAKVNEIRRQFPGSQAVRRGQQWQVHGPTDFHLQLSQLGRKKDQRVQFSGRWSGDIHGTAENIMTNFAAQMQLQVKWSTACTAAQKSQYLDFAVDEASLSDILDAFATASQLRVRLEGKLVTIEPSL